MSGAATYLYAVTRPVPADRIAALHGIGGVPVRLLSMGDLACAVSTVNLDEFGAEAFARNLEKLAWLERVAREHDAVVQALAGLTTVVPLRLGAVYLDDDSALVRVAQLRDVARATLDVLDGREEWGVKLYALAQSGHASAVPAGRPESGLDYLRRRRGELERKVIDTRALEADADAVFERLCGVAVLARRHRLQDPALTGVQRPMLLNAAYLVGRDARDEFHAAVDALARERAEGSVVVTGPWPPYSFATLDDP